MKIRKHFRTSSSTIDLISMDFSTNRIVNREIFFNYCVNERLDKLNTKYDEKLDKISSFIIRNFDHDDLPLAVLSRMVMSLTKVTNALSKGLLSIMSK